MFFSSDVAEKLEFHSNNLSDYYPIDCLKVGKNGHGCWFHDGYSYFLVS